MSIVQTIGQSANFAVVDHVCQQPRVDCGTPPGDEPARIILTRRGSFAVRVGNRTCFARPSMAVLVHKNVDYRIAHPDHDSCDCCTDVRIDDAVLDMLGLSGSPACCEIPHDLDFQKLHVQVRRGMLSGNIDAEASEEVLFDLLGCLMRASMTMYPRSAQIAQKVVPVQDAILGSADVNLGIHELAALVGCSPFYLCRLFRLGTGHSLRQYRLQVRLGNALGRLDEGEEDLAALACDVGFSSHSHMTEVFRQVFGRSPSQLREELSRGDLDQLRNGLRSIRLLPPRRERGRLH